MHVGSELVEYVCRIFNALFALIEKWLLTILTNIKTTQPCDYKIWKLGSGNLDLGTGTKYTRSVQQRMEKKHQTKMGANCQYIKLG